MDGGGVLADLKKSMGGHLDSTTIVNTPWTDLCDLFKGVVEDKLTRTPQYL